MECQIAADEHTNESGSRKISAKKHNAFRKSQTSVLASNVQSSTGANDLKESSQQSSTKKENGLGSNVIQCCYLDQKEKQKGK